MMCFIFNFSGVTPSNKEVKTGTDVTLSCSISGISGAATVLWKKSGTPDLSNSIAGHTVAAGNFGSEAQVSILTLTAAVNTADTTFTCDVTPSGGTVQETTVQLNVFSVSAADVKAKPSTIATLTCTITGLSAEPSSVFWQSPDVNNLDNVAGYKITTSAFVNAGLSSELEVDASVNLVNTMYSCVVVPDGGIAQPTSVFLSVFSKLDHT